MFYIWLGLGVLVALAAFFAVGFHIYVVRMYMGKIVRIFFERPLFIIPHGQPVDDAEDLTFASSDGRKLRGCYLKAKRPRKGVILFGLEFGSKRWACVPYCEFLREQGFDIFSFEPRSHGDSEVEPEYEPAQWVSNFEIRDFKAAIEYLKNRPDADPNGIGLFGLSKGGSAGLMAAADDDYVRCFAVDGIFATCETMVPYMRKWIMIYSQRYDIIRIVPTWYYRYVAYVSVKKLGRGNGCKYPPLEPCMKRLAPRPLLMIHGGSDSYIKPEMAQNLFDRAQEPKEFWLVDKAKHNQAFQVAGDEYQKRLLAFFEKHLADGSQTRTDELESEQESEPSPEPAHRNGQYAKDRPLPVSQTSGRSA